MERPTSGTEWSAWDQGDAFFEEARLVAQLAIRDESGRHILFREQLVPIGAASGRGGFEGYARSRRPGLESSSLRTSRPHFISDRCPTTRTSLRPRP